MSPAVQRGFGYALIAVALLWLALNGLCSYSVANDPGDYGGPGAVLIFSPIIFGPSIGAGFLGWRLVARSRRPPQADGAGFPLRFAWIRLTVGACLVMGGALIAIPMIDGMARDLISPPPRVEIVSAPSGVFIKQLPSRPGPIEFVSGEWIRLHFTGLGLVLILFGAWIATPAGERGRRAGAVRPPEAQK